MKKLNRQGAKMLTGMHHQDKQVIIPHNRKQRRIMAKQEKQNATDNKMQSTEGV